MSGTLLSADTNGLFRFKYINIIFAITVRFLSRILAFLGFHSRETKTSSTRIWIFRKSGIFRKVKIYEYGRGAKISPCACVDEV